MKPPGGDRPVAPGLSLEDLLTVTDQTDVDGRLLLEDSAPEKARRRARSAGVAMETVECPYRDSPSRQGGVMNVSAYEALRADTAEILDGVTWLCARYLEVHPTRRRTVQAFFDVSQAGITLPLVLFHRATDPVRPHRALPTYIASIFKACRGMFSAAVDMRNRAGPPFRKTDADEIVAFVEEHGHFRRAETARVCAGPTRLVERTVSALVTGAGGEPARSALGEAVDVAVLWGFCRLQEDLGQTLSTFRAQLDAASARVGITDPDALFRAVVPDAGGARPLGQVAETVVARAGAIQADLNRLLGRRPGPSVRFQQVMAML